MKRSVFLTGITVNKSRVLFGGLGSILDGRLQTRHYRSSVIFH